MIAVDTNVLARVILDDDVKQSPQARKFLAEHAQTGGLYISPYVFLELAWLLKSRDMPKEAILLAFERLVHANGIHVGHREAVVSAISLYASKPIEFADALIVSDASLQARAPLATYDKKLRKADSRCVEPV